MHNFFDWFRVVGEIIVGIIQCKTEDDEAENVDPFDYDKEEFEQRMREMDSDS